MPSVSARINTHSNAAIPPWKAHLFVDSGVLKRADGWLDNNKLTEISDLLLTINPPPPSTTGLLVWQMETWLRKDKEKNKEHASPSSLHYKIYEACRVFSNLLDWRIKNAEVNPPFNILLCKWKVIVAVHFQFKQLQRRSLKKSGLQRDSNPWPPDTGAMLYQLNYEATHWERGQFIEFISPVRSEICEVYLK